MEPRFWKARRSTRSSQTNRRRKSMRRPPANCASSWQRETHIPLAQCSASSNRTDTTTPLKTRNGRLGDGFCKEQDMSAPNQAWDNVKVRPDFVPKESYLDPAFVKVEAERLWKRVWQVACRLEEIPKVGDY